MEEPQPPEPGECCGSGCSPCVWDLYYDKLEKYENWKAAQGGAHKADEKVIEEKDKGDTKLPDSNGNQQIIEHTQSDTDKIIFDARLQSQPSDITAKDDSKSPQSQPVATAAITKKEDGWRWVGVVVAPCCIVVLALAVDVYLNVRQ